MTELVKKVAFFLDGKLFTYENKEYVFKGCKVVNSNLMILTDKKTLQVPIDTLEAFFACVQENARFLGEVAVKKEFKPSALYLRNDKVLVPDTPVVFEKINASFDSLIDAINNADEGSIKILETKAKILTSVAQTAVNMENTKINLMQLLNK